MALLQRKGIWYWRKMIDGVQLNRSMQTDDKKRAEKIAKKWEHDAFRLETATGRISKRPSVFRNRGASL